MRLARGIGEYFNMPPEATGYIMGTVKDKNSTPPFTNYNDGEDSYLPINGAQVKLYKGTELVNIYPTDEFYNGIYVFEDLEPACLVVTIAPKNAAALTLALVEGLGNNQYKYTGSPIAPVVGNVRDWMVRQCAGPSFTRVCSMCSQWMRITIMLLTFIKLIPTHSWRQPSAWQV